MKQTLSRTAVVLATSALTLGLTAAGATATGGAYAGPADGPRVGPGAHGGEFGLAADSDAQRKIDRLRKALAAARAERMAARAAVVSHAHALSDRQVHANDAAVALLVATDVEHKAKADLSVARTRLNEVRALIKNGSTLLAENQAQQGAAAAKIVEAQDDRAAAETTADDLHAALPGLLEARDAAADAKVEAEAEIAWLTGNTIPLATSNATGANQQVESLRQQTADAFALYTERTWAYHECRPQPDGWVNCLDFTYNWAIRGEVSDPWQRYLDLQAQQVQAQDVADDMATKLADAQADLTYWNGEHATRTSTLDAAQAEVDATRADITAADEALAAAAAAVTEAQDTLDALVVAAVDLTERLSTSKADEKKAAAVETTSAAALVEATAAVKDAEYDRDMSRADVDRAERTVDEVKAVLADAQAKARYIKDRLKKARQKNR